MPLIRMATEKDAAAVLAIYGPFCESTVISFEYEPPSIDDVASRITNVTTHSPWLVLDDRGVIGYAYASRHRERAAYAWSIDTAVYIHPAHHRRGVGRALYTALFHLLRRQGYFKAFAGVTLPNPASVGLHRAMGYQPVGVYRGVGYKHGAWRDVAYFQLMLQPERLDPAPPRPVGALADSIDWATAVETGLAEYRQ